MKIIIKVILLILVITIGVIILHYNSCAANLNQMDSNRKLIMQIKSEQDKIFISIENNSLGKYTTSLSFAFLSLTHTLGYRLSNSSEISS